MRNRGGNIGLGSESPAVPLTLLPPSYVVLRKSPNCRGPALVPRQLRRMDLALRPLPPFVSCSVCGLTSKNGQVSASLCSHMSPVNLGCAERGSLLREADPPVGTAGFGSPPPPPASPQSQALGLPRYRSGRGPSPPSSPRPHAHLQQGLLDLRHRRAPGV